ncbi:MAG: RDD family protein [Planctomycetaceae bacterium]
MSSQLIVDTRVTVETPEGVDFRFVIAGPGKRGMAFVMDTVLVTVVSIAIIWLVSILMAFSGTVSGAMMGVILLVIFVAQWLYRALFEAFWNGQTPGKRSAGLRVVRTNGTPIGWFEAFGRSVLLVADGFVLVPVHPDIPPFIPTYSVALLSMFATARMQRLGDIFFDTMVIDESREFISRAAGVTHGIEPIARTECSGRYHVPERTLAVIERLFEGDRIITDGRREEIARPLSSALRRQLGFAEPPVDPRNPNTYFRDAPVQHTAFLRRILKTFSEDPREKKTTDRDAAAAQDSLDHTAISHIAERSRQNRREHNPFAQPGRASAVGTNAAASTVAAAAIPPEAAQHSGEPRDGIQSLQEVADEDTSRDQPPTGNRPEDLL